VLSVNIKTTPERLYEVLTTQKGLSGWWTPNVKAEPTVGAIDEFYFGDVVVKFRVDKLEPGRHVAWSGVQQIFPDWEGTLISFDITPEGDGVNLKFSQTGFESLEGTYAVSNYSWAQFLRSIKLLIETGEGEPFGSAGSRRAGTS
jgi:uncharacterized protein YndB with AHSA1/START domain